VRHLPLRSAAWYRGFIAPDLIGCSNEIMFHAEAIGRADASRLQRGMGLDQRKTLDLHCRLVVSPLEDGRVVRSGKWEELDRKFPTLKDAQLTVAASENGA
jgi:hypothetical protein